MEKRSNITISLHRKKNFNYLWLPYGIGQTVYIFMLWFVLSFFSSPNLSRSTLAVCHTSTHGVALVRI